MKRRRIVIVLVLLAIAGGSWYVTANTDVLTRMGLRPPTLPGVLASGFIEGTDVAIAPETGGRIVSISAAEGDEVKAGVTLIRLDDSILKAQEKQAESAVSLAQANLEQAAAARTQATVSRDGAKRILDNALDIQKNPLELGVRITSAQNELNLAEVALKFERELSSIYPGRSPDLFWTYSSALQRRENAKAMLQSLLDIRKNPQDVNGAVEKARAAYDSAAAAIDIADRAVVTAERQVTQAKAALEVIRAQSTKLTVVSPVSGQVAARNAEVGEVALPGAAVLTVTRIDEVTLTAYVPESRLGLVKVGQEALVSVDSYPGTEFTGRVTSIGTRALFTPKNIQLKEEREKTMYPVKIKLANADRRLKAGMPADARIITQ